MRIVFESLNEFLNESIEEMYWVSLTDRDNNRYSIIDKNGEAVWEGSKEDTITFLLRNAGLRTSVEARNLLQLADKFRGRKKESGNGTQRKGPWGRDTKQLMGTNTTIYGALVMIHPSMIDKEINKGRLEASRKTLDQVAKKQTRERTEAEKLEQLERRKKLGIKVKDIKRAQKERRDASKEIIKPKDIEKKIPKEDIPPFVPKQTFGSSKDRRQEAEKALFKKTRPRI
jgi:hypothetical protein